MKKLLTIALALVMVFAIAAPAFAMGSDALGTVTATPASDEFTVEVKFYKGTVAPATGNTALDNVPATDMFAKNQEITVGIFVTSKVKAADHDKDVKYAMSGTVTGLIEKDDPVAIATAVVGKAAFINYKYTAETKNWGTGVDVNYTWDDDDEVYVVPALTQANLNTLEKGDILGLFLTGHVATDVAVSVAIGQPGAEGATENAFQTTDPKIFVTTSDSGHKIEIMHKDASAVLTITTLTGPTKDLVNKVDKIMFDGTPLSKDTGALDLEATVQPSYVDGVWANTPANVKTALKATNRAAVDAIFNFFGLDYAKKNSNQVKEEYFLNKADTVKLNTSATAKLFTQSLTVADTTTVPNTGDNAAVIGFVMIALAIVAAAAVAVKKVRA